MADEKTATDKSNEAQVSETIHVFDTPNGTLRFTEDEFNNVVECFRILMNWRDETEE